MSITCLKEGREKEGKKTLTHLARSCLSVSRWSLLWWFSLAKNQDFFLCRAKAEQLERERKKEERHPSKRQKISFGSKKKKKTKEGAKKGNGSKKDVYEDWRFLNTDWLYAAISYKVFFLRTSILFDVDDGQQQQQQHTTSRRRRSHQSKSENVVSSNDDDDEKRRRKKEEERPTFGARVSWHLDLWQLDVQSSQQQQPLQSFWWSPLSHSPSSLSLFPAISIVVVGKKKMVVGWMAGAGTQLSDGQSLTAFIATPNDL